jgi:lysophospholipase L1-like esterase
MRGIAYMNKKSRIKKIMFIALGCVVAIILVISIYIMNYAGLFSKGNAKQYSVAQTESLGNTDLTGKTIIFLGSSVTKGAAAKGESFVDFMEKRDGMIGVKEAVSGTLLVDTKENSYVSRIKTIDPAIDADAFVCQLSTNDATKKQPLGRISDSFSKDDFDTKTVAGAIEYIISYAKETWDSPVIFYTGTQFESEEYEEMVFLLLQIQKKWDIGVIDLWNNEAMKQVNKGDYKLYMVNEIHPSRAGYREWWTPVFESYLSEYLQ